uniref:helix-turn-helix domain-containing protein n=4 Tax=Lachnospiraceae TaxID=186803 RepID=UPI0003B3010B
MSFKHKYTFEEKERILLEYQTGTHGFKELCRIYGMAEQALKDWIRLYETFGMEGLKTGSKASCYSKEVKEAAIQDYLMHTLPVKEILI